MNHREELRSFNYPEEILAKMTDDDCEGEWEVVTSSAVDEE